MEVLGAEFGVGDNEGAVEGFDHVAQAGGVARAGQSGRALAVGQGDDLGGELVEQGCQARAGFGADGEVVGGDRLGGEIGFAGDVEHGDGRVDGGRR